MKDITCCLANISQFLPRSEDGYARSDRKLLEFLSQNECSCVLLHTFYFFESHFVSQRKIRY